MGLSEIWRGVRRLWELKLRGSDFLVLLYFLEVSFSF